jgi:hypothetical protein
LANGGFLGLALYEQGQKSQARELWGPLADVHDGGEWEKIVANALALDAAGEHPRAAFFVNAPSN